ncbi:40S ribosomal protein S15a-5-like protein, partial [Tanacetum coccineum]
MLWHQNSGAKPMPLNSGAIAFLVPNSLLLTWHHFLSLTPPLPVLGRLAQLLISIKKRRHEIGFAIAKGVGEIMLLEMDGFNTFVVSGYHGAMDMIDEDSRVKEQIMLVNIIKEVRWLEKRVLTCFLFMKKNLEWPFRLFWMTSGVDGGKSLKNRFLERGMSRILKCMILRVGKIKVELLGRIKDCRAITYRQDIKAHEIENYRLRTLPTQQWGYVVITTPNGALDHEEAIRQNVGGQILEDVWNKVKAKLKNTNWDNNRENVVATIASGGCRNTIKSIMERMTIATVIYYIWNERNKRIFSQEQRNCQSLFNGIEENLKLQLLSLKRNVEMLKWFMEVFRKSVISKHITDSLQAIAMVETLYLGVDLGNVARLEEPSCIVNGCYNLHNDALSCEQKGLGILANPSLILYGYYQRKLSMSE